MIRIKFDALRKQGHDHVQSVLIALDVLETPFS